MPKSTSVILITRPAHQATELANKILAVGAIPLVFPTLEIRAPKNLQVVRGVLERIDDFDIAIFTSANAVASVIACGWEETTKTQVIAIGKATAAALTAAGIKVNFFPTVEFNSEALLQQPVLKEVAAKRIVIFAGEGGRTLLQDVLIERGALVTKVASYQRVCPNVDMTPVLSVWQAQGVNVIVSTSCESLQNLYDLVGETGRTWLLGMQLVVISQRMVDLARQLGFVHLPIVAQQASNESIFEALRANVILA